MMTENFEHKIRRLELENFTCFTKAEMNFSSGINVFIGENGTGKTHVLKALYALTFKNPNVDNWNTKYLTDASNLKVNQQDVFQMAIGNSFDSVFKVDFFTELIKEKSIKTTCTVLLNEFSTAVSYQFEQINDSQFRVKSAVVPDNSDWPQLSPLFIPASEMISIFQGFISAYEKRENSFDATYYFLAKNLESSPLKDSELKKVKHLSKDLETLMQLKVTQDQGRFFIKFNNLNKTTRSSIVATGINKLAQMIYLIRNGSLNKNTILFWDEPETNLNPKYIKIVAQFLQTLAKNGVQIFVATHDYLLTYWLSLAAEYPNEDTPPMRFFSLSKGEDGTEVEAANTMNGLKNNVLLDEYSAYSDAVLAKSFDSLNEPV